MSARMEEQTGIINLATRYQAQTLRSAGLAPVFALKRGGPTPAILGLDTVSKPPDAVRRGFNVLNLILSHASKAILRRSTVISGLRFSNLAINRSLGQEVD